METIGERVKRLRESRGWTQAQLTGKMNLNSATTLSRIENGVTRDMRMPMARKLAEEVYNFIMNPENVDIIDIFVKEQILNKLKENYQRKREGD